MGEMLKHIARGQPLPDRPFAVVLTARPQNMVMRAGHIADGVDLNEPQTVHNLHQLAGTCWRFSKSIGPNPKPARIAVRQAQPCLSHDAQQRFSAPKTRKALQSLFRAHAPTARARQRAAQPRRQRRSC